MSESSRPESTSPESSRPESTRPESTGAAAAETPVAYVASAAPSTTPASARRPLFALEVSLAVLFGLFYAYDVWEAIGNLVGVLQVAAALDTALGALGWVVLVGAVLLPIVLFAGAFALGRRRTLLVQAGIYLAGLAASAALYLDIVLLVGPGALFA